MYKSIIGTILVIFSLTIGILCFAVLMKPDSVFASNLEIIGGKLGISITQDGPLFNMPNMAPGDTGHSTLTVKNNGDASFSFTLDSLKESGDESLFKGIIISVKNDDNKISYYNGSLQGLQSVAMGSIPQGGEEKYNLSVIFPTSIGNEFQQKTVSVRFIFTASSDDEELTEIIDEVTPEVSGPDNETDPTDNPTNNDKNENIPLDRIPKTGETPPQLVYYFGILMAVIGLKLGMKIRREA